MTLQYLKNPQTNEVIKNESFGSFFDDWIELTESEILAYKLQEAKTAKIIQLKANRNTYTAKSMDFTQAKEITFDEFGLDVISKKDFYFKFNVNAAGQPALEPDTIILSAQIEPDDTTYTRYSCSIIDGEITRKGYIMLNKTVATTLQKHIKLRASNAIKKSNEIEVLINACTTVEELNAINIDF